MKVLLSALFFGSVALAGTAAAQDSGSPRDGFAVANQICSECHAVKSGEAVSPHLRAPTFQKVANAPGMNAMTLRVWFQTSHPSMPNLMLSEKDGDDLIAYILSLKKRS